MYQPSCEGVAIDRTGSGAAPLLLTWGVKATGSPPDPDIYVPRSDSGVSELLGALDEDRREVESTDIEALEAEIDEAVYDLFNLVEDEREVIEEYLEGF